MKTRQEKIEDRDKAILFAREIIEEPYFVLDTETTGKDENYDQMVQLAILESNGKQFKSLVKPTIPIKQDAFATHHISEEDIENAPTALEVVENIPIRRNMVVYNMSFDMGIIINSVRARKGIVLEYDTKNKPCDLIKLYAEFRGEWSEEHNNYKYHKLDIACKQCDINIDLPPHDAMSDVIRSDCLIKYIANQKLSTEQ